MKGFSRGAPGLAGQRRAPAPCGLCALLALAVLLATASVSAQDLVVVETSPADRASVDKLAELVREPFTRVRAPDAAAAISSEASRCLAPARRELIIDTIRHVVKLIRCRDGTVLSRALDPEAAARTPYLGAFVAAELLGIDRELESIEARQAAAKSPPVDALAGRAGFDAGTASSARAAVAGSGSDTGADGHGDHDAAPPVDAARAGALLRLRAGAELALWGAPFRWALRPSVGLGLELGTKRARLSPLLEIFVAAFASGAVTHGASRLALNRSDGQLRAGALLPLAGGRLALGGFALLRGSLTSARYSGQTQASTTQLRWGVGAGLEADLTLTTALALYAHAVFDLATSQSEYFVGGVTWLKDPAELVWLGGGLVLRLQP